MEQQPLEIIALIVAERISPSLLYATEVTLESFANCKREDEPRRRSFQTRDCLALVFLNSREKSSGKQLYGRWKRERERKKARAGRENEKKRSKRERTARSRREDGGGKRNRRKLWKAFPRLREKFVIENRGSLRERARVSKWSGYTLMPYRRISLSVCRLPSRLWKDEYSRDFQYEQQEMRESLENEGLMGRDFSLLRVRRGKARYNDIEELFSSLWREIIFVMNLIIRNREMWSMNLFHKIHNSTHFCSQRNLRFQNNYKNISIVTFLYNKIIIKIQIRRKSFRKKLYHGRV